MFLKILHETTLLAGCVKCFMMAVSIFVLLLADLDLILRAATEAVGVIEDGPHLHSVATSGVHFRIAYTKGRNHLLHNELL